jgi:hypothetical protein
VLDLPRDAAARVAGRDALPRVRRGTSGNLRLLVRYARGELLFDSRSQWQIRSLRDAHRLASLQDAPRRGSSQGLAQGLAQGSAQGYPWAEWHVDKED